MRRYFSGKLIGISKYCFIDYLNKGVQAAVVYCDSPFDFCSHHTPAVQCPQIETHIQQRRGAAFAMQEFNSSNSWNQFIVWPAIGKIESNNIEQIIRLQPCADKFSYFLF